MSDTMDKGNFFIDKKASVMIKGLAIILMFIHHFFGFPSWIAEENMYSGWVFHGIVLEEVLGQVCKICVSLFAFISGYALYINQHNYSRMKDFFKKAANLLFQYWIIFILFIGAGILFKEPLPSLERFIAQCFGTCIATGFTWKYNVSIHPVFAWYVSFFLLFLLLHPVLRKLSRYNFGVDNIIFLFVFHFGYALISVQSLIPVSWDVDAILYRFATWGHIGMIGYLFAKYRVFIKIDYFLRKFLPSWLLAVGCFIASLTIVYARYKSGNYFIRTFSLDTVYTPLLIYAYITVLKAIHVKWLCKGLQLLGTYSMNMWFLHGIFFSPNLTFQHLAYWGTYPIVILVWTLAVTMLCSIPISYLQRKLQKQLL